ncbi:innexin domain-containing protein [Ditylenchus destructor]|uniref:Innexin domain-containing protein n=1 Tax=Ditylenchus destructor TaxID=166010 RepID=A0AAD4RCD8_9BILA|nr:innexin domain-containing protein [Ditylenchus destructor]
MADVDFRREKFHAELDEFVRDYIKIDGVFVLRILTIHAGMLVCTQIVDILWEEFRIFSAEAAAKRIEGEIIEPALSSAVVSDKDRPQLGRRKIPVLAPLTTQHDHYYHGGYGTDSKSFPPMSSLMASRMDLRRPSMGPSNLQSRSGLQTGATSGFPQKFTAAAAGVTSNQRTGFRRFSTPAAGHSMARHGPTPIHRAATLAMTMSQFDMRRESMDPTNMPPVPPIRVEPSEEVEEEEVPFSGQRRDQYLRVPTHSENAENEED